MANEAYKMGILNQSRITNYPIFTPIKVSDAILKALKLDEKY